MPELLQKLRDSGKELAVATSKPAVFSQRILDHFDLTKYFCFLAGSELNGDRTDKAEVIRYALQNLPGGNSANSIMVGDRKHDVIGAKGAGIPCVGVLYGYGDRAELEAAGADYIAGSIGELYGLLAQ
jgi:phosphoglycolate phosphatase